MNKIRKTLTLYGYTALLALLFGGIFAGQVLGFLKLYTPAAAIILTLAAYVAACWFYIRSGGLTFLQAITATDDEQGRPSSLETALYAAGLILLVLLVLLPVIRWPASPIATSLEWDAGAYHFPKAIELYATGSAWDFTISYGEYPFGYESLLALGLSLTGSEALFGLVHGLINLTLVLSLWLLARRYTKLPGGVLFFLTNLLVLSGMIPVESNLWWVFHPLLYTIGKNDLFLGAALLAALLHAPVGRRANQTQLHPAGLAITSMIALSIKPNALYVVTFLWLLVLIRWRQEAGNLKSAMRNNWQSFLFSGLTMLTGLLWLPRNLIGQGSLFSPGVMEVQSWSIAANFNNPFFYNYIPRNLLVLTAVLVLFIALTLIKRLRRLNGSLAVAFVVLFVSFLFTPATAFFVHRDVPTQIAWRFAVALLGFAWLALLTIVSPLIEKVYAWVAARHLSRLAALLIIAALTFSVVWFQRDLLPAEPRNARLLRDPYEETVGVDGYHSAYDYAQQNIHNSVVWVENGLPYYVYDKAFSNTTTRSEKAQYVIVLKSEGQELFPEQVYTGEWEDNWQMIYEDPHGRVYVRK
ncbi:MAG: hypothetical protein RBT34_07025 [Anaerolineaceae bacterium]|jgi:hypothetical protein|nr:hypothetical protein [Anaerolineaceae bacterium]